MKVLVWEDKASVVGHGGSLRTIILDICQQLSDDDVQVCYTGETDPAFPSWAVSVTDAGYATVAAYAAAVGAALVNRSYTSAQRMTEFETAGVPIVHACTGEVGNGPGWCCFVGRDYFDLSTVSAASNALDFKLQYDGTLSAATATITGHLVNLLYNHPVWNFSDARQALRQTAGDYAAGWTRDRGYGYIDYNAANALADAALLVPTPGDLRATVNNSAPSVTVNWSNLPAAAAGYTSTKLVLFASLPDSSTPIASGTTLYDGVAVGYVWDSASPVAPATGTHFLAIYAVDDQAGTSRFESYAPLTVTVAVVEPRTWYVDNELVGSVHDGLSWETAYANFADVVPVSGPADTLYLKATDTPYLVGSLPYAAAIYADASGVGTERGSKRSTFINSDPGLTRIADLVPDQDVPALSSNWGGAATKHLVGLHDGKRFLRLLKKATGLADCLATPGSWFYDADLYKTFVNKTGLPADAYIICSTLASYARSYGGQLCGVDWMFHFPGASYLYLASQVLWEDMSVSYSRSGPYAYAYSSPHGITMRRVVSHHIGGYSSSEAFDLTSRADTAGGRIRLEYCLAENCGISEENDGLAAAPVTGFLVTHNEPSIYAHYGVELINCTARDCSGARFKQTGANGKLLVENCHGTGAVDYGAADFDQSVSTATVTCINNRASSTTPYAGTWEANKGTGAAENNEIELQAAPVAGLHDQAEPARDANGKPVYTLPDIGAVQVSGPLCFNAAAPAGGNGTRWRPFNAFPDYQFSGFNFRAGGVVYFAGTMGALDLSALADTGAKTVMPWPHKSGSMTGFVGGINDIFNASSLQGVDRGVFKSLWLGKTRGDDGLWRSFANEAVDFTDLPPAAANNGRVMRCNPLVAGQPYLWVESDGVAWRPLNGAATLYTLQAPLDGTDIATEQILLQIPIPPGLLQIGSILRVVLGGERLGGTADGGFIRLRMGGSGTYTGDEAIHNPSCSTTIVSMGSTQEYQVLTNTTIRKHGASTLSAVQPLAVVSTNARAAELAIADVTTETNILSLSVDLTTGGLGEYFSINGFALELIG